MRLATMAEPRGGDAVLQIRKGRRRRDTRAMDPGTVLAILDYVEGRGSSVHTRDTVVGRLPDLNHWDVADHLARCVATGLIVETHLPSVGGVGNTAYRFTLRLTESGARRLADLRDRNAASRGGPRGRV